MNETSRYFYKNCVFQTKQERIQSLLRESNLLIEQMDSGKKENNNVNRNSAIHALNALNNYLLDEDFKRYKSTYNDLWSRIYRLYHVSGQSYINYKRIQNKWLNRSCG